MPHHGPRSPFLHLKNADSNRSQICNEVKCRKFSAQNQARTGPVAGGRPLEHLLSARNIQAPFCVQHPIFTPYLPWGALLLNPQHRPEASLNFASEPAVTHQATRWPPGVRQVTAEASVRLKKQCRDGAGFRSWPEKEGGKKLSFWEASVHQALCERFTRMIPCIPRHSRLTEQKNRLRDVKEPSRGHTARKWQSCDLNQSWGSDRDKGGGKQGEVGGGK